MTTYWVCEPVVDLNEEPIHLPFFDYLYNPKRVSQCLFGEKVTIEDACGDFFYVKALEQPKYTIEGGWHAYPGWVPKKALAPLLSPSLPNLVVASPCASFFLGEKTLTLSYGTSLYGEWASGKWKITLPNNLVGFCEKETLRPLSFCPKNFVSDAHSFLGTPYLFGGRSAYFPKNSLAASVDCSGLASLLHRASGICIPRDAHDQYLQAKKTQNLDVGTLLFMTPWPDGKRVSHVIIYLGNGIFIEAPQSGEHVRLLKNEISISNGKAVIQGRKGTYKAELGTFL